VTHLYNSGKSIVFFWVPGHCGLTGNEVIDAAAMHGKLVSHGALRSDVCTCIHCIILSSWGDEWDNAQENILHMVKPSVQEWQSFRVVRRRKLHSHLWIGHTCPTHGYLLHGELTPVCRNCGVCLNCGILCGGLHTICQYVIFTVQYPTCSAMISIVWAFISAVGLVTLI
jgi:hypothetical protein